MGTGTDHLSRTCLVTHWTCGTRAITQVEGLNIPMSVGPPSVDKDNAGQECIVYDVIINPKARYQVTYLVAL